MGVRPIYRIKRYTGRFRDCLYVANTRQSSALQVLSFQLSSGSGTIVVRGIFSRKSKNVYARGLCNGDGEPTDKRSPSRWRFGLSRKLGCTIAGRTLRAADRNETGKSFCYLQLWRTRLDLRYVYNSYGVLFLPPTTVRNKYLLYLYTYMLRYNVMCVYICSRIRRRCTVETENAVVFPTFSRFPSLYTMRGYYRGHDCIIVPPGPSSISLATANDDGTRRDSLHGLVSIFKNEFFLIIILNINWIRSFSFDNIRYPFPCMN